MSEVDHRSTLEGSGVSFSGFILSLASNAMTYMGEGGAPVNFPLAAQNIDIIALLRQKTEGNLDADEKALLDSVLFDLRMKYVALASSEPI